MNLLIFGPQGSGKGTQADLLAEKFNLCHIETGHIFREIAREDTELGHTIKALNEQKEMIPDHITMDVLRHYLTPIPKEIGVILDSAPRTWGQIEPVEQLFAELGRDITKAIYITLPYATSVERITRRYACTVCYRHFVLGKDIQSSEQPCPTCSGPIMQRGDDTPEGIAKRLKVFYDTTVPVIEHYRERNMLLEVDGNLDIQSVFNQIVEGLQ